MRKLLATCLLTLFAYLAQVSIMPYLQLSGTIGANILCANIAIITVTCGKKYVFLTASVTGVLMECMLSSVALVYLLGYPVLSMLFAQAFADMSERRREEIRMRWSADNKKHFDLEKHPYLRIVLCAACLSLSLEIVLLAYNYLVGMGVDMQKILHALACTAYTAALTLVLMLPVRRFAFGIRPQGPGFRARMRKEEYDH